MLEEHFKEGRDRNFNGGSSTGHTPVLHDLGGLGRQASSSEKAFDKIDDDDDVDADDVEDEPGITRLTSQQSSS
jgi:hypothetical protein